MADDPINSGGAAALPPQRPHVAVIFFQPESVSNGKYESTAALLESLDDWVFKNHHARAAGFDRPRLQIRSRSEECRGDQSGDAITYLQADYQKSRVRFYEAYWAPATVMGERRRCDAMADTPATPPRRCSSRAVALLCTPETKRPTPIEHTDVRSSPSAPITKRPRSEGDRAKAGRALSRLRRPARGRA